MASVAATSDVGSAALPEEAEQQHPCDAPRYVRRHLFKEGWDVPASNNIAAEYFKECDRLHVHANTAVAKELLRYKQATQPALSLSGLSLDCQIQRALRYHDCAAAGSLSTGALRRLLQLVSPSSEAAYSEALGGISPGRVPLATCQDLLLATLGGLDPNERTQSLLDMFAMTSATEDTHVPSLLRAAFRLLDTDGSGSLTQPIHNALLYCLHAEGYLEDLDQAESTAAKNDAGRVDEEGFVSAMLSVGDINEGNARGMYLDLALTIQDHTKALLDLNFAGSYCGNKGVLALIKPICEHYGGGTIDLSSSGLHNAAVKQLCEALTFHEAVEGLRLDSNPISGEGVQSLLALLGAKSGLITLTCANSHIDRGYSRTHHNSSGPAPGEDAGPLFQAALQANQESTHSCSHALVLLTQHMRAFKEAVSVLMDDAESISAAKLMEGMKVEMAAWGIPEEDFLAVLQRAGLTNLSDDLHDVVLHRAVLFQALWPTHCARAAAFEIRRHLAEVKQAFYLAAAHCMPAGDAAEEGTIQAEADAGELVKPSATKGAPLHPASQTSSQDGEPLIHLDLTCKHDGVSAEIAVTPTESEDEHTGTLDAASADLPTAAAAAAAVLLTSAKLPLDSINLLVGGLISQFTAPWSITAAEFEASVGAAHFAIGCGTGEEFDGSVDWTHFIGTVLQILK